MDRSLLLDGKQWRSKMASTAATNYQRTSGHLPCPTSYITSESISLLEQFHAWQLFGATDFYRLSARVVEAIFLLENELRSERNDGENQMG